ncbi:MAG: hypothetical protein NTU41_08365, partial [Chloroflexi bacterium]|nr:hypothetical protein [Chloroflexota bacterium]
MASYGYAGKMLRVDLSSGTTALASTLDYADRFLGGRGIAAKVHWDEVPPEAGALDAENRLTFAIGPLAGIPALGGSRWVVCGKSPLPVPEQFSYSNLGGRWGAELKFSGYDAIVVHGQSDRPVYLFVHDGAAEIRDATDLWGKGAIETRELLKSKLGDSVKVVAIGPAGENMVATASLLADNDASGSGGLGAVMGSKKLKAIAVKGKFRGLDKGVFNAWGSDFMVTGTKAKKDPCYGCLGNCLRVTYTADNGSRGKFMCQSGLFYLPWSLRYYGQQNEAHFHANKLCDAWGLDTWALEQMVAWLYRCYKSGVVTEETSQLPMSKIGSLEFIETLISMISLRQGFGDLLAQGMVRAAAAMGHEAVLQVKHVDPYEPRLYITTALLWATEPREPIQALHEVGLPLAQWSSWAKKVDG